MKLSLVCALSITSLLGITASAQAGHHHHDRDNCRHDSYYGRPSYHYYDYGVSSYYYRPTPRYYYDDSRYHYGDCGYYRAPVRVYRSAPRVSFLFGF